MATVLGDYQVFKHERIFNPALTHADPELAGLAREMKVECIAAGETFRAHLQGWRVEDIRGAWTNYQATARLTINQPRRHRSGGGGNNGVVDRPGGDIITH
jgi:hypothetical protein